MKAALRGSLLGVAASMFVQSALALEPVTTQTLRSSSGETMVRVDAVVARSPEDVWKWLSTEEGMRCWVAPVVRLDFRVGGKLETNYDPKAAIGDKGTITLGIANYVDASLLTLKVKLNDSFSRQLQAEDGNLQEVIQLERRADGGTRIVSTMLGWGSGPDWEKAVDFFAKGNVYSIKELVRCVNAG